MLGTKWKEAIDISQQFSGYLAKNSNELGQDVMQKTDWQNVSRSGTENCGSHKNQYSVFKQRTEILAFTCLHWFSQLYQSREDVSLNNTEGIINDKKFAVLGVGNRSGAVMFWKVMVPVKVDKAIVQLGGILNTGQSWPSSLSWKETNLNQGNVITKFCKKSLGAAYTNLLEHLKKVPQICKNCPCTAAKLLSNKDFENLRGYKLIIAFASALASK